MTDDFMRSRFLIKDGEVFSRERIANGLENLRKVYGERGYLNYTGVPSTKFDDKKRTISVVVALDSGKRFYISNIDVLGRDDTSAKGCCGTFHSWQVKFTTRDFGSWDCKGRARRSQSSNVIHNKPSRWMSKGALWH